MDLPRSVAESNPQEVLTPKVAELSQESESTEASPYVISFGKYNEKLCEIDNLIGNKGKKVLNHLKTIGMNICSFEDFRKNNLEVRTVTNEGEYKKLFNHLGEDIELKELIIGKDERLFFFVIESEKVICIVTIKASHFETNKNRR